MIKYILIFGLSILISFNSFAKGSYLNVTTFNIGALSPFSSLTKKRVKQFCKKLKHSNYDLVFIQEAWQRKYRKRLKKCGFPYVLDLQKQIGLVTRWKKGLLHKKSLKRLAFIFNLFRNNYGYDTGLLILSKHPFLNSSKFRYLIGSNEDHKWDGEVLVTKGAIGATILHPSLGEIFVATTHLVAEYSDHTYNKERLDQFIMLTAWLEKNAKNNPVIITGDFNVSPPRSDGSDRYNKTNLIWNQVMDNILFNFHEVPLNFGDLTTFPNKPGQEDSGVLDHIFVSKSLDPYFGEIIFKETYKRRKKKYTLSDHYGLNVQIR